MSKAATSSDSTDVQSIEYTDTDIAEELEVASQPAMALAEEFDSWEALRDAVEGDDTDLTEISGVGSKTAEALESNIGAIGKSEPPTPDVADDPEVRDGVDAEAEAAAVADAEVGSSEVDNSAAGEETAADDSAGGGADDSEAEGSEPDSAPGEATDSVEEDAAAEEEEEAENAASGAVGRFEAIIEQAPIYQMVNHISKLVDEAKIRVYEDRLEITCVDASNVGMMDFGLNADAFEKYDVQSGVMGVNIDRLQDILGMFKGGDAPVHMNLDTDTKKLHLSHDGLEYTMALIDPASIRREPDLPDLNFASEFTVEANELKRVKDATDMVADHFAIVGDEAEGAVRFEAKGDTDRVEKTAEPTDNAVSAMLVREAPETDEPEHRSLFSLDYFKTMMRCISKSAPVEVEFGQELPVMVEYQFADGAGEGSMMLAPRIQA